MGRRNNTLAPLHDIRKEELRIGAPELKRVSRLVVFRDGDTAGTVQVDVRELVSVEQLC